MFDAWGALIKLTNAKVNITDGNFQIGGYTLLLDRGYTGHEHLTSVGLIHMNGRLYDPRLHRFLQPDNYVQDTTNTQSYNRYGYCWNNPLKYTDPSGEIIPLVAAVLVGAFLGATTYFVTTVLNGGDLTLAGFLRGAITGAISGAVTFGIGEWMKGVGDIYLKATYQALAHGTFNGMMSGIQGGKFWSGFASGALSSIASSLWGGGVDKKTVDGKIIKTAYRGISGLTGLNNGVGTIIFGTISGGAGASLTGGNFWQGAATGFMVSGLNHAMHEAFGDDGPGPKPKPKDALKKAIEKFVGNNISYDFFGATIRTDAITAFGSTYHVTLFGTIHTSAATYSNYLKYGFEIQKTTGFIHESTMTLMHEFGHYLHAQYAPLNFYSYAAISSAATANFSWAETNWTEITANTYSYYYFGQPKGWDFREYPINSNYLHPQTIKNLKNHK